MAAQPLGYDFYAMKTITLLSLAGVAFCTLAQPTWAAPRGGRDGSGSGGHFTSGGRVGGFAGGGSRAAPAFHGGGVRAAPALRGTYFTDRSVGGLSRAPRFYYGGNRVTAVQPREFTRPIGRSTSPSVGRFTAANRQPNRTGSIAARSRASDPRISTAANRHQNRAGSVAGRNRVADSRTSTAAQRQSFVRNHASERHDANSWHRDWDRHHSRFHHNKVFVFIGGLWWGLDPWLYPYYAYDYYPYSDYGDYGYNPHDYSYGYPYDYSANPYDYYNYSPYSDDDQPGYSDSGQSVANATVSAVQSELAKLGYYNGAIDGTLGDQTEAALARYQEDRDLSVTGTVDGATLQSLGIR
jgi:Putative peptidoglycan binding domain